MNPFLTLGLGVAGAVGATRMSVSRKETYQIPDSVPVLGGAKLDMGDAVTGALIGYAVVGGAMGLPGADLAAVAAIGGVAVCGVKLVSQVRPSWVALPAGGGAPAALSGYASQPVVAVGGAPASRLDPRNISDDRLVKALRSKAA